MVFSTLDDDDDEKCDRLSRARSLALSRKEKERKNRRLNRTPFHSFVHSFVRFSRVHAFVQEEEHVLGREKSSALSTPFVYTSCVLCLTRRQKDVDFWLIFLFFFSLFGREFLDAKHSPLSLPFTNNNNTALATTSPRRRETIPKRSRPPWLANPTGTPTKVPTRSRSPRKRRRPRTPRKTRKPRRDAPPPPPRWRLSAKPPAPNQRKVSFPAFKIPLFFDSLTSRTEEVYE